MYLIYLTFLIVSSDCYKILCLLPYPGKSHHMVFEPLLDELSLRGHEVTVVSFFPSAKTLPRRRDVSLTGLAPLNVEVVNLSHANYKFYGLERFTTHLSFNQKLAKNNLKLCEKLINSQVFDEFVEGKGDYDLILYEDFNSDCMLGLIHNYQLPFIGLSSCAMLPWSFAKLGAPDNPSYVPLMTMPFTDNMSFWERLQNTVMSYIVHWWFEVAIRWEEQRILEKRFGKKLPLLTEVAKNTSAVFVNTHYSLNGVRVMPPTFVEIGGLHLHNKSVQPLPEHLEKWVSGAENGFILLSFGSLIRGSTLPPKQLSAILKVVAGLKQRVLWKWEMEHIDNLPPNVLISKWLPQYDLLNHPNCVAFITHGGLLSLTEAVSIGVPTVLIAVLGDQFHNAAHAHLAYGAPYMTVAELEEDRLRDAIDTVLSPETRTKAKQLSELWHSRPLPPMETAIFYVEQTARFKGLHMSSHARFMNKFVLYQLDILGVVFVIIGVIFVGVNLCCRKCKVVKKKKVS